MTREKLKIYSDPLRGEIVNRLSRGAATTAELAAATDEPPRRVRYRLRRMGEVGLIDALERSEGGPRRNLYSIDPVRVALDAKELSEIPAARRYEFDIWTLRLLFREMMDAARGGHISARPEHGLVRFPMALDDQGWRELADLHADVLDQALDARRRCLTRLETSKVRPMQALLAILLFERASAQEVPSGRGRDRRRLNADRLPDVVDRVNPLILFEPQVDAIITALLIAPAGASELADRLELPIGKIRYQLRRLSQMDVILIEEKRPRRGTVEWIYAVDVTKLWTPDYRPWQDAERRSEAEVQLVSTIFREAIAAVRAGTFHDREGSVLVRIPTSLDALAMAEIGETFDVALERMFALRTESDLRLKASESAGLTATSGLFSFEMP